MEKIEKIIKEIKGLRGEKVSIFGQPTVLNSEVNELTIDIVDVLEGLKEFEVDTLELTCECQECEGQGEKLVTIEDTTEEEWVTCDNCNGEGVIYEELKAEEVLETWHSMGYVEEIKADNSYNWSSPISNDFDFKIYENYENNKCYIELSVHRFGDVRGNYTDSAILEFDSDYTFLETLSDYNKYFEVDGLNCEINIFSDSILVCRLDGTYLKEVCAFDMEELKEEIKNLQR